MTKDELEAFLCDYKLLCLKHRMNVGWDYSNISLETIDDPADDAIDGDIATLRRYGMAIIEKEEQDRQAAILYQKRMEAFHNRQVELLRKLLAEGKDVPDHLLTDLLLEIKRQVLAEKMTDQPQQEQR